MGFIRNAFLVLTLTLTAGVITPSGYASALSSTALKDIRPLAPDSVETPGHLCNKKNTDFEEYRYGEKIPYCKRNVSTFEKHIIYELYNVPEDQRKDYTIDHFIPLSIGGSNEMKNLWPEHKRIKALRRTLEMEMFMAVRDGELTQKQAVEIIRDAKLHPPIDFR